MKGKVPSNQVVSYKGVYKWGMPVKYRKIVWGIVPFVQKKETITPF